MHEIRSFLSDQWVGIILTGGIILLSVGGGYVLRAVIFKHLNQWAHRTRSNMDDIIIASIRKPFIIWCVMGGIYVLLHLSDIPMRLEQGASKALFILGVISVTMTLADALSKVVRIYARNIEATLPVTSLTENIIQVVLFAIGALTILHSLGVSITPILASLGIGGLAVALALQETLANFFSGFHIIVSKQIKVGDYVKLETGEEGYVTDINWRITKIRALPNNVILVPNSKLTQTIITNYHLPEQEMAVLVQVGVHYNSDLKHVQRVTCEVAKEVMVNVSGGVAEFDPFIRYHTFADFSINFTVILRAKQFVDQYLIKHEFIMRLYERYKKEGINIPYPIRAINYEQEQSIK